jgi:hypothetical protein
VEKKSCKWNHEWLKAETNIFNAILVLQKNILTSYSTCMYNDLKRSVYFLKITDNPSRNPFLWWAPTACRGSKSSSCDVAAAVAASIERELEERLGYCAGI